MWCKRRFLYKRVTIILFPKGNTETAIVNTLQAFNTMCRSTNVSKILKNILDRVLWCLVHFEKASWVWCYWDENVRSQTDILPQLRTKPGSDSRSSLATLLGIGFSVSTPAGPHEEDATALQLGVSCTTWAEDGSFLKRKTTNPKRKSRRKEFGGETLPFPSGGYLGTGSQKEKKTKTN